jgi:archaellum component FlaC
MFKNELSKMLEDLKLRIQRGEDVDGFDEEMLASLNFEDMATRTGNDNEEIERQIKKLQKKYDRLSKDFVQSKDFDQVKEMVEELREEAHGRHEEDGKRQDTQEAQD